MLLLLFHLFFLLLYHSFFSILFVLLLFLFLFCLAVSLDLFIDALAPIFIDLLRNPGLNFDPRNSLHAKYFHPRMVSSHICIWNSLDSLRMLTFTMLHHWVNWWKFFWTFWAAEVFSFLMMVQYDLVFKWLITIETEWS